MTSWSHWIAAALLCLGLPATSQALTVVGFEDISPNDLADGYGGLSGWAGLGGPGIADADRGGQGLKVFYGHGGLLGFDGAPVRVFGAYYKSYAVPLDEPPQAAIELWYHGRQVASLVDPRSPLAMTWLATDYAGPVDTIRLRGGLEGFAIDDLSYERIPVSGVPDPAPWLLLSGGLALLGWRCRQGRPGAAVHHAA